MVACSMTGLPEYIWRSEKSSYGVRARDRGITCWKPYDSWALELSGDYAPKEPGCSETAAAHQRCFLNTADLGSCNWRAWSDASEPRLAARVPELSTDRLHHHPLPASAYWLHLLQWRGAILVPLHVKGITHSQPDRTLPPVDPRPGAGGG